MHRIRLGPPWTSTPAEGGRTRHARPFGRPRTPDPGERVWLVCDALPAAAAVLLNGEPLTLPADVTDRLRPRNVVGIEGAFADAPAGVALEIVPGERGA